MQSKIVGWIRQNWHIIFALLILAICFFVWIRFSDNPLAVNLFSSAVFLFLTIVIVDSLIERMRLQKSEESIAYVNERIRGVCRDLINGMNPPKNWEQILATKDERWKSYYSKTVLIARTSSKRLERTIETFFHLIRPRLLNDVLKLARYLEFLQSDFMFCDLFDNPIEWSIDSMTAVALQSMKIIREYNLESHGRNLRISSKKGEPPKVELVPVRPETAQNVLSQLQSILNELLKMRENIAQRQFESLKSGGPNSIAV